MQSIKILTTFALLSISLNANGFVANTEQRIGTLKMSKDRSLILRMFEAPKGADTQIIKPSDRYYQKRIEEVGGLNPGEKKFLYRTAGEVTMNADGSIKYIFDAVGPSGEALGASGISKPSDPNYNQLIHRVGGLIPGQTKAIPYK